MPGERLGNGFPWHVLPIPQISASLPCFTVSFGKRAILTYTDKFKVYPLACVQRLPLKMEWEEVDRVYMLSPYSNATFLKGASPKPSTDGNLAFLLLN